MLWCDISRRRVPIGYYRVPFLLVLSIVLVELCFYLLDLAQRSLFFPLGVSDAPRAADLTL